MERGRAVLRSLSTTRPPQEANRGGPARANRARRARNVGREIELVGCVSMLAGMHSCSEPSVRRASGCSLLSPMLRRRTPDARRPETPKTYANASSTLAINHARRRTSWNRRARARADALPMRRPAPARIVRLRRLRTALDDSSTGGVSARRGPRSEAEAPGRTRASWPHRRPFSMHSDGDGNLTVRLALNYQRFFGVGQHAVRRCLTRPGACLRKSKSGPLFRRLTLGTRLPSMRISTRIGVDPTVGHERTTRGFRPRGRLRRLRALAADDIAAVPGRRSKQLVRLLRRAS